MKSLSRVRLFATPWTVTYQAPPSMGFSRQEYWSGLPFPSPGHLPDPGIEPGSPTLQANALTSEPPGKPIPLDHPSAPALSTLSHASNLDWQFISHMIMYMFQCHSPKSSHPRPLPQSPKDCSIHLCPFCCLTYRVIINIFLNSIYMH